MPRKVRVRLNRVRSIWQQLKGLRDRFPLALEYVSASMLLGFPGKVAGTAYLRGDSLNPALSRRSPALDLWTRMLRGFQFVL